MSISTNKQYISKNNMIYATKINLQNIYTKILSLLKSDFVPKRSTIANSGFVYFNSSVKLDAVANTIYTYDNAVTTLHFNSVENSDLPITLIFNTNNQFNITADDNLSLKLVDDGTIFEPNTSYVVTIQNKILSKQKLINI